MKIRIEKPTGEPTIINGIVHLEHNNFTMSEEEYNKATHFELIAVQPEVKKTWLNLDGANHD